MVVSLQDVGTAGLVTVGQQLDIIFTDSLSDYYFLSKLLISEIESNPVN